MSGELADTVLGYLQDHPEGCTSKEFSEWAGCGAEAAANSLLRLVVRGRLVRATDQTGRRGRPAWRYTLAGHA